MVTQILGGVGAVGGSMVGGYFERKRAAEAAKAMRAGIGAARGYTEDDWGRQQGYYDPYVQAGERALGDYESADFTTEVMPWDYQDQFGQTSDFLDPSIDFQQDQARRQMEASAAASGGLYSGSAMKALQDRSQQIGMQDFAAAHGRQQQEYANKYGAYTDNFTQRQANNAARAGQLESLIGAGQWGTTGTSNASANYGAGMANLGIQEANVNAAQANIPGAFENFATSAINYGTGMLGNPTAATPGAGIAPMSMPTNTSMTPQMQMGGMSPSYFSGQQAMGAGPATSQTFGASGNLGATTFGGV